jgi:hypothetical protein
MKSTIMFLGLALLTVSTTKANELQAQEVMQQEVATITVETKQQLNLNLSDIISFKIGKADNTGDTAIFNPETVFKTDYSKPMQEVINEDKLLTEAQEEVYQPLCLEMSVLDKIQEDNQIIESNISEEVFPLDFEKINRTAQCIKVNLNDTAIPVDVKL